MNPMKTTGGATATTHTTKQMVRLTPDQYRALEAKCPPPDVNNDTTEIAAGMRLGVQLVLKLLREGFVVGE